METSQQLVVIAGPTAAGKSAVAMALARLVPTELISADSMQIYQELDIGTSQPTAAERAEVPHHLVDELDIQQPLDVYLYVEKAEAAILEARNHGRIPVLVGGTGMYIRALLYGLDRLPADLALKERLWRQHDGDTGPEKLVAALAEKDPAAVALCAGNPRRLLRALEVLELTGTSITNFRSAWKESALRHDVSAWRLSWRRPELFERIIQRTDAMLAAGWLDEAKRMIDKGLLDSPTAHQAIGYKIIAEHLAGNISFEAMRDRIVTATKKYARRQETWFSRQHPEMRPLPMPTPPEHAARTILESVRITRS